MQLSKTLPENKIVPAELMMLKASAGSILRTGS